MNAKKRQYCDPIGAFNDGMTMPLRVALRILCVLSHSVAD